MLKINLDKMEKIDISVDSYVTEVKNLANRMKHVYAVIEKDSYGMNTEKVKQKIEHWYKVMEKEAKAIENMGTGLEQATVKYHNMENDVVAYFTGLHAEKVTMKNNAVDRKAAEKKTEDKYKKDKIDDSLYKNSSTAKKTAVSGSGKGTQIKSQNKSNAATNTGATKSKLDIQVAKGTSKKNEKIIKKYVQFAVDVANDNSHGYDQGDRVGVHGNYDCSGLVCTAVRKAGVKVNGSGTTATMKNDFLSAGFKDVRSTVNMKTGAGLQVGDILHKAGHTCIYVGNGKVVDARINENGTTKYGKSGDQTGHEIEVHSFSSTYHNYTSVFRLK